MSPSPTAETIAVSVITPAFNASGTIRAAVESVVQQSLSQWEAIVVDDGSRDDTAAIVRSLAASDGRIRLVQQPNAGLCGARNSGIAAARGTWLIFLDADDWLGPEYLQKALAVVNANPSLDAVHCLTARVALDGTTVDQDYIPPTGDIFSTLATRSAFAVHACMVRRSVVVDLGGFDPAYRFCEDWDLWQRIARTGAQFGSLPEVHAFYRMSPTSMSLDPFGMIDHSIRVARQGHAPDPRVLHPHPEHALGSPEPLRGQEYYILAWSAGLQFGHLRDARPLLNRVIGLSAPELSPEAIAECVFASATTPLCRGPRGWAMLWPDVRHLADQFFAALENQSGTVGLSSRAYAELQRLVGEATGTEVVAPPAV